MSTAPRFDTHVALPAVAPSWQRRLASDPRLAAARSAWRRSLPLMAAVAIRVIPGPTKILAYVWSMVYAFWGRRQAIMALVVLWLCNMFTHAFGFPPAYAAIFRHLTVFGAAISVLLVHASAPPRTRTPLLLMWTAVLGVLLIGHSLTLSTMPDISALKAISFSVVIYTLLTAWSRLSPSERTVTENQVWGVLYGVCALSAPLVVTGAGYFKNSRGFQGLLEHPQAFGPTMAFVAVWLFATWLTDRRMRPSLLALLALSLAWVFLSQARIGAVVLVTGVVTAVIAGPFTVVLNRSARIPRILKGRLTFFAAALVTFLVIGAPFLSGRVQEFITKTGKSTTAVEAAWESRGYLIEMMQENIRQYPLTGIGFGVASAPDRYFNVVRDPIFGIAIMATVEKGVLPVAIVEELGWPLALLYAPWFFALLVMAVRAGPRYAGVCAAALVVNVSECVFFSPGGGGLIVQVLVAMAATAPPASQDTSMLGGWPGVRV